MKVTWQEDFEKLYRQRGQQKHGIRLLALWKLQSGMTETEVCGFVGKTHKTIRIWRRLYEESGLDALLKISRGRGRKAKLDSRGALFEDIKRLHEARAGGRIRCQDVVDLVDAKYNIEYSRSGMYHVLHRLGFSWITSRSKHPHSDPAAIAAFKKTSKLS